jgi:hypothetical protein
MKKRDLISIREIADDDTTISSTRWAFASVVKADLYIVVITILSGIVGHFLGKPIPNEFYASVALLLGVITGIIGGNKALQGFETKKNDKPSIANTEPKKEEDEGK